MKTFASRLIMRFTARENSLFILILFGVWRIHLDGIAWFARFILPLRTGYLGPIPWANFDGVHYLSIAEHGYYQFEQAFFPLYPFFIRLVSPFVFDNKLTTGFLISNICFLGVLYLFDALLKRAHIVRGTRRWGLVFLTFFPTSFYFGSLYTESIFLFLVLSGFYALERKHNLLYGLFASIASAVRLVGVFMWVPIGTLFYMLFLQVKYNDALMFLHAQPAFGANRTAGELVILPQVYWRYFKIFMTVSSQTYDFWIALYEFVILNFVLIILFKVWKSTLPRPWLYFSVASILGPTLTGTLSSVPRYALIVFPIYVILAKLPVKYRFLTFAVLYALFIISTMLFTRGYWIS